MKVIIVQEVMTRSDVLLLNYRGILLNYFSVLLIYLGSWKFKFLCYLSRWKCAIHMIL